jgi:hypothetical protein
MYSFHLYSRTGALSHCFTLMVTKLQMVRFKLYAAEWHPVFCGSIGWGHEEGLLSLLQREVDFVDIVQRLWQRANPLSVAHDRSWIF